VKSITRRTATFAIAALAFATLVSSGAFFVACGEAKRPDGGAGLLPVGASSPDVVGVDASGKSVRLSSLRGHAAVVFFYPKDGSPGCTKEACAFRDAFTRFESAGVTLFGVSRDSVESHATFAADHHLPFPLVSDESGEIERAYGVGSFLGMTKRVSFLVDAQGKIARVWPDVDPGIHADEVLAAASAAAPATSATAH
jgi:peroxiredoxin Q/BCP